MNRLQLNNVPHISIKILFVILSKQERLPNAQNNFVNRFIYVLGCIVTRVVIRICTLQNRFEQNWQLIANLRLCQKIWGVFTQNM